MAKDWYPPREIWFTRATALWLIQNLGSLRAGSWPPEASNYIDIPGKKGVSGRAPFATPIEYAAEIETRLEKCGRDGLILLAIECWGLSEESLAKFLGLQVWSIRWKAERALRYVASGQNQRWHDTKKRGKISYQEWIEGKRWNKETGEYYWIKRKTN